MRLQIRLVFHEGFLPFAWVVFPGCPCPLKVIMLLILPDLRNFWSVSTGILQYFLIGIIPSVETRMIVMQASITYQTPRCSLVISTVLLNHR